MAGATGLVAASGSVTADHATIAQVRIWTHESVSDGMDWDWWFYTFEPAVSQAVRGIGNILNYTHFYFDIYYAEFRTGFDEPTTGYLPSDPQADDLRELTPDFAHNENTVNIHLIYDGNSGLGRSSARYYENRNSGECFVNLGFLQEEIIYYLFPEIIIHEAVHCMMSDGGRSEHEHGTPAWNGNGTPTIMGTGYGHEEVNEWWGSQVPNVDCFGNNWSDGTVSLNVPPEPLPVLTDCTVSAMGEHLLTTAIGPFYIDYEYDSDTVVPWPT